MRKLMSILIMAIFAGCHVFAQIEGVEKLMERYIPWRIPTLRIPGMKSPDTACPAMAYGNMATDGNRLSTDADTACVRPVVCLDKMYYKTSISGSFRPETKYDCFKEKLNEPWLGDILKDFFFR